MIFIAEILNHEKQDQIIQGTYGKAAAAADAAADARRSHFAKMGDKLIELLKAA